VGSAEPDLIGPRRSRVIRRVVLLIVALVVLYLFAPTLGEVFSAWPQLAHLNPPWMIVAVAAETASFTCVWWLLKQALRAPGWFAIATSQLAGNALSCIMPAGAAPGAALQYKMLGASGVDPTAAGSALTATALLQLATLSSIPVLGLLVSLTGRPLAPGLKAAAWLGLVAFVVLVGVGAVLVLSDRVVGDIGAVIQWARNRIGRHHPPIEGLPDRLRAERDLVSRALGKRWPSAVLASVGKWAFDYFALLACLAAVGARPEPTLILLAYAAAVVLGMIPITPGGLGFVEAGLTGALALAGVPAGAAVLATLSYRLVSFWLPLPAGLGAYAAFRYRQRSELKEA
jgi:uncharacterized protein (TIRG00374 family)